MFVASLLSTHPTSPAATGTCRTLARRSDGPTSARAPTSGPARSRSPRAAERSSAASGRESVITCTAVCDDLPRLRRDPRCTERKMQAPCLCDRRITGLLFPLHRGFRSGAVRRQAAQPPSFLREVLLPLRRCPIPLPPLRCGRNRDHRARGPWRQRRRQRRVPPASTIRGVLRTYSFPMTGRTAA